MGLWDTLCENIFEPVVSRVIDGVKAVGSGIDKVVTTGIDVVGARIDSAVDAVKEIPLDKAAIVAATAMGGGFPLLENAFSASAAKSHPVINNFFGMADFYAKQRLAVLHIFRQLYVRFS